MVRRNSALWYFFWIGYFCVIEFISAYVLIPTQKPRRRYCRSTQYVLRTSASAAPMILTAVAFSSYSCSFCGGAACHVPVIATDVPVPKLRGLSAISLWPQGGRQGHWTCPSANRGSSTACKEYAVDPSPNSTNERCFWFRMVLIEPSTVIVWPPGRGGVARMVATFGMAVGGLDRCRNCT